MDEGLTAKLNFGALHYAIDVLQQSHPKLKVTAICRRIDRLVLLNANSHHAANKNVELGGRDAFKRFKHGVTGYILGERRMAMLTGARPFSGPSLPFCLPIIATRSIVLSIGAESSG